MLFRFILAVSIAAACGPLGAAEPEVLAPDPDISSPAAGVPEADDPGSALPVLREMLDSEDSESRVESLEVLGQSPDSDSARLKFDALFDNDSVMRQRAAENLKNLPAGELTRRLLDVLRSGEMFKVQVIEEALPALQPIVEPSLIEVLEEDPDQTWRVLAAYALGCMKAPAAAEPLAKRVWQEDRVLSMTCVQALGRMRTPETLPYLQSMLGHSSEEIRWEAVHGIGNLKTPEALSVLVAVATNGQERSVKITKQALLYLGYSDRADAIPLLIRAMEYSQSLRDVASEALFELTGKRYGANAVVWRRWYDDELAAGKTPEQLLWSHQVEEAQQEQMKGEIVFETIPEVP